MLLAIRCIVGEVSETIPSISCLSSLTIAINKLLAREKANQHLINENWRDRDKDRDKCIDRQLDR